jgi:hypothetical protein
MAAATCRCGHERLAHAHYRHGSNCALCDCRRFRVGLLRRVRHWFAGRDARSAK